MSTVTTEITVKKVAVHPLVLLSVVDHFNPMHKTNSKTCIVVGLLRNCRSNAVLDMPNNFALPFDEDDKDNSV